MTCIRKINLTPFSETDPTGACPNCVSGAAGALAGGGWAFAISLYGQVTDNQPGVNWGRVRVATGKGAVVGAVIGATGNIAAGAATAAALGGIDGAATEALRDDSTVGSIVVAGGTGAVVDGASAYLGGTAGAKVTRNAIASQLVENTVGASTAVLTQATINEVGKVPGVVSEAMQNMAAGAQQAVDKVKQEMDPRNREYQ